MKRHLGQSRILTATQEKSRQISISEIYALTFPKQKIIPTTNNNNLPPQKNNKD